jgi:hypothetical protein
MREEQDVSAKDQELMIQYNIKKETRTVFFTEGYKYDNLNDAIRYARLSAERKLAHVSD